MDKGNNMLIESKGKDGKLARLYVEEKGSKKASSTFILPGGPGAALQTYLPYTVLDDVTHLVFHDPRGCGQSSKGNPATYNMQNYIADVETIRQQLKLKKINVIGKSYGSMCALGYALHYPEVVNKLVLVAGAPSYRFLNLAKQNLLRIGSQEQIKIAEKLWSGDFASEAELLKFFKLTNSLYSLLSRTHPEKFDLEKKIKFFSYEVLNQGFKNEFWHFDYEDQLEKIACPTLILAGRHDWINDVTLAQFMSERIPDSTLHIFDNASHAMEADVKDAFFAKIKKFIAS